MATQLRCYHVAREMIPPRGCTLYWHFMRHDNIDLNTLAIRAYNLF